MAIFLIWSKKRGGAWYRPESKGYTLNTAIAGRFTEIDAKEICAPSHGECVYYRNDHMFVSGKHCEFMADRQRAIRGCLETMTPQQVLDIMPELIKERIDIQRRNGI